MCSFMACYARVFIYAVILENMIEVTENFITFQTLVNLISASIKILVKIKNVYRAKTAAIVQPSNLNGTKLHDELPDNVTEQVGLGNNANNVQISQASVDQDAIHCVMTVA